MLDGSWHNNSPCCPEIEADQVKGLSLYALRAVMSGCGDEVLDLAKLQPPALMRWGVPR